MNNQLRKLQLIKVLIIGGILFANHIDVKANSYVFNSANAIEIPTNISKEKLETKSSSIADKAENNSSLQSLHAYAVSNSEMMPRPNACSRVITGYYKINNTRADRCFTPNVDNPPTGFAFPRDTGNPHLTWTAGSDLFFTEYSDDSATITGTIQRGSNIGVVHIDLTGRSTNGATWSSSCYQSLMTGERIYYPGINGTVTVNTSVYTVTSRGGAFVLANGAGLQPGSYGMGGWSGGTFGSASEWFGRLVPMTAPERGINVSIGDDVTVCNDTDEVILNASITGDTECNGSAIPTYLWSNGATTASITVNEPGNYAVTVTSCGGCSATDEAVVVFENVVANAGADVNITEDQNTTLTATGGESYLWNTGESTASINVAPNVTTIYSVTVTSENGCEATDEVTVNVDDCSFETEISTDVTICLGEEASLGASGGDSYLWSTGETTASVIVNPNATTTYWVDVKKDGCNDSQRLETTVTVVEVSVNAGDDVTISEGQNTTLTATGEGAYLWNTGETTAAITVSPDVTTTYTVTLTGENGCQDTDEVTVRLNLCDFDVDITDDTTICKGSNAIIVATGGDSYVWSTGETTASISVSPEVTTAYWVDISNDGCDDSQRIGSTVVIEEVEANAGEDVTITLGTSTTITATGGGTYLWNTGENTDAITVSPEESTTYSVIVVNSNGCEAMDEVTVTVNDCSLIELSPRYKVNLRDYAYNNRLWVRTGDTFILDFEFEDVDFSDWTFAWEFPDGSEVINNDANLRNSALTIETAAMSHNGTFKVTYTAPNGCTGNKQFHVQVISQGVVAKTYPIPAKRGGKLRMSFDFGNGNQAAPGLSKTNLSAKIKPSSSQILSVVDIAIYDMQGRMVTTNKSYTMKNSSNYISIQLDYLNAGNYILKVIGADWDLSKIIVIE